MRACRGRDGACSRRDPATGRRPLVVDVGAHVGWFSALAASYGCRVLSFEPQPHAHPFLNATITLNGWTERWRSVWGAVSSGEAGGARMKMVNRHGWDNWDVTELVPLEDPDDGDEVPVWRLDDLVREDVALLKIDAEGHEDYVVASAASLLANHKVGAILVEAKGGGGDDRDAFKREWFATLTESQGYYPYEFYEEVGRSVYSWSLAEHLFPIHPPREFAGWPANQVFEDHLFSRAPLALPLPGTVSVQVIARTRLTVRPIKCTLRTGVFLSMCACARAVPSNGSCIRGRDQGGNSGGNLQLLHPGPRDAADRCERPDGQPGE